MALHAGTVETQGRDPVDSPLNAQDTFVASLARLGLGQVSSLKGDWFHFSNWDQNLLRGHELGTVLWSKQRASLVFNSELSPHLEDRTFLFPGEVPVRRVAPYLRDTLSPWGG